MTPAQKFRPTMLKTLKRKTTIMLNCPSLFIERRTVLTSSRICGITVSDLNGRSTLKTKRKRVLKPTEGKSEIQPVVTTRRSSQFHADRR
jgi:hypothetical protein